LQSKPQGARFGSERGQRVRKRAAPPRGIRNDVSRNEPNRRGEDGGIVGKADERSARKRV